MAYTVEEFLKLDLKKLAAENPKPPPDPHWADVLGELIEQGKLTVGLPINLRLL
jgi:hypothetical protein